MIIGWRCGRPIKAIDAVFLAGRIGRDMQKTNPHFARGQKFRFALKAVQKGIIALMLKIIEGFILIGRFFEITGPGQQGHGFRVIGTLGIPGAIGEIGEFKPPATVIGRQAVRKQEINAIKGQFDRITTQKLKTNIGDFIFDKDIVLIRLGTGPLPHGTVDPDRNVHIIPVLKPSRIVFPAGVDHFLGFIGIGCQPIVGSFFPAFLMAIDQIAVIIPAPFHPTAGINGEIIPSPDGSIIIFCGDVEAPGDQVAAVAADICRQFLRTETGPVQTIGFARPV